ncbi:MAG: DNA cytosine methyltransferase [Acidimicrobiia bacterium]
MTERLVMDTYSALQGGRQTFEGVAGRVVHRLSLGALRSTSSVASPDWANSDPKGAWWRAYLEGSVPVPGVVESRVLRTVDLFCGPGGLANGLKALCSDLGVTVVSELAVDQDPNATVVYAANHGTRRRSTDSVARLVDFSVRKRPEGADFTYPPDLTDRGLSQAINGVDLVLAGPPCQGHSNLNNHTRREDPRNSLYLTVPAFAVAIGAPMCIIENVPAVLNDSTRVVEIARSLFERNGYHVETGMLSAAHMGWPQTRRRHFLVARREVPPIPLDTVARTLGEDSPRSVWWAIGDLEDITSDSLLDAVTGLSAENVSRIDWLFDNDEHDLALPERPVSHRGGTTYTAVYGRLQKDAPSQTITTGFMSPGRGRYVHPTRRRVLTAHEAARIQGFPDTYAFNPNPSQPPTRALLAKWIGDAVPMPLGYGAALSALGGGLGQE